MGAIVSAAEVRDWSKRPNTSDVIVNVVIDAAEAALNRIYVVPEIATPDDVPADVKLGVLMQCARLLTRPDSPNGVVPGFESGALRISRFDPDIDLMLGLKRKPTCA